MHATDCDDSIWITKRAVELSASSVSYVVVVDEEMQGARGRILRGWLWADSRTPRPLSTIAIRRSGTPRYVRQTCADGEKAHRRNAAGRPHRETSSLRGGPSAPNTLGLAKYQMERFNFPGAVLLPDFGPRTDSMLHQEL